MGHETSGPALRGGIIGCGKEVGIRAEAIEVLTGCVDHGEGEMYFDLADVVLVQVIESNIADALPLVAEYLEYRRFDIVAGIEDAISGCRGVEAVNSELGPVKGAWIFAQTNADQMPRKWNQWQSSAMEAGRRVSGHHVVDDGERRR